MTMMRVLTRSGVIEGSDKVKSFVASPDCVSPFWLDVVAPGDSDVRWLGEVFGFHPLTLEDLLGINNRPKLEEYGDYIFLVVRELVVPLAPPPLQGKQRTPQPLLVAQQLGATEVHMYLSERYFVTVRAEEQCAVDAVWRRVTTKGLDALGPRGGIDDGRDDTVNALQPPSGDAPASTSLAAAAIPANGNAAVTNQPANQSSSKGITPPGSPARSSEAAEFLSMSDQPENGAAQARQRAVAKRLPNTATLNHSAQPASDGQRRRNASRINPYEPQLSASNPFSHGLDFLMYNVLDDVVDSYFDALEAVEDEIDALEDVVVEHPTRGVLDSIFTLKGNLMILRKQTTPMREAVNTLVTHEYTFVNKDNLIYFRDVYGLLVAVYEIVDTERDNAISVLDAYLSSVNNNLNVVMKRLTGISGLFLPITAITGFAGMNLASLPNAQEWYNYVIYFLLICVPLTAFYIFKRNDWL